MSGDLMKDEEWVEHFKEITDKAIVKAEELRGTRRAREKIGQGAGGDTTVVMDRVLEDIIIDRLKDIDNVRLISEERGVLEFGDPENIVVADPLDGSFNAKMGIPLFSMSLALARGGSTMGDLSIGLVRDLVSGDQYHAVRNGGAFVNGEPMESSEKQEIRVIGMEPHPNTILTLDQNRAIIEGDTRLRSLGCISLDLCYLARGIFDTFIDVRDRISRVLDIAAGKVIIEEAGGVLTDETGEGLGTVELDTGTRINFVAASNRIIHEKVLNILRSKGLLG